MLRKISTTKTDQRPQVPEPAATLNARQTAVDATVAAIKARADFANGVIDAEALQAAEDHRAASNDALRGAVGGQGAPVPPTPQLF